MHMLSHHTVTPAHANEGCELKPSSSVAKYSQCCMNIVQNIDNIFAIVSDGLLYVCVSLEHLVEM